MPWAATISQGERGAYAFSQGHIMGRAHASLFFSFFLFFFNNKLQPVLWFHLSFTTGTYFVTLLISAVWPFWAGIDYSQVPPLAREIIAPSIHPSQSMLWAHPWIKGLLNSSLFGKYLKAIRRASSFSRLLLIKSTFATEDNCRWWIPTGLGGSGFRSGKRGRTWKILFRKGRVQSKWSSLQRELSKHRHFVTITHWTWNLWWEMF